MLPQIPPPAIAALPGPDKCPTGGTSVPWHTRRGLPPVAVRASRQEVQWQHSWLGTTGSAPQDRPDQSLRRTYTKQQSRQAVSLARQSTSLFNRTPNTHPDHARFLGAPTLIGRANASDSAERHDLSRSAASTRAASCLQNETRIADAA
jgi:hypothetical protein